MEDSSKKSQVKKYYNQEAAVYTEQYTEEGEEYPANLLRLNIVVNRLNQSSAKSILDTGCGSGFPMIRLLEEGFDVEGFDFSEEMVKEGKQELDNAGYDPKLIYQADLTEENTLPKKTFDVALALGIFPHIPNEKEALLNMRKRLDRQGKVFIEFRNDLFAAYTLNKYSLDFFLNRVIELKKLPDDLTEEVVDFYSERLKEDKPNLSEEGDKISYSDIYAKFKNPLSIEEELFQPNGFSIDNILFYHYHALPPVFENERPELFKELSLKLENPNSWKGYLTASAFVVEATKVD